MSIPYDVERRDQLFDHRVGMRRRRRQTQPLGAAPYGLDKSGPTNPEMEDDHTPYPTNPALSYTGPSPSTFPGLNNFSGIGGMHIH